MSKLIINKIIIKLKLILKNILLYRWPKASNNNNNILNNINTKFLMISRIDYILLPFWFFKLANKESLIKLAFLSLLHHWRNAIQLNLV